MLRLLFAFFFIPTLVYPQLDFHYKSQLDSFEVRLPQEPEIREATKSKAFARNYKSYEVSKDWYFQYDISYTSNKDGTPIKVSEKNASIVVMENFLKGLVSSSGKNGKEIYSKAFKYNGLYPATEYKISFSAEEFVLFKEGFFVLKGGKFINACVTYLQDTEIKIIRHRYKLFTSSFKF